MNNNYKELFDDNGHLNEEGISLCTEALIIENREIIPSEVSDHVEECQHCKSEIIELYEICKNNPQYKNIEHPFFKQQQKTADNVNYPLILKIAAAILLLLSIGFLTRNLILKESVNKPVITKKEPVDTIHNNQLNKPIPDDNKVLGIHQDTNIINNQVKEPDNSFIAVNFEKYPVYENLIKESYRSDSFLRCISPKQDQHYPVNKPIFFEWEGEITENVRVVILNNKADIITEIINIDNNNVRLDMELQPALYYWKLETEDDLIYIGKFLVK